MAFTQIVVAAANFAHAFPSQMYNIILGAITPSQELIQCSTAGMADSEKERLEKILEKSKPAALIGISIKPDKSTIDKYRAAGAPVVLFDEEVEGAVTITTDNYMGGYMAGDHLAKSGRKRIGVVSGRLRVEGGYNAMQRVSGFIKALADNGLTLPEGGMAEVISYSYNDGIEAMVKFLDDKRQLDAIFCAAGDMCALGILKTARERGVKVPEDMALIGYDDLDVAKTSRPALTTIKQPIERMAMAAYDLVINKRDQAIASPSKVVFNPELVKRVSA